MKITKRQLNRIIRRVIKESVGLHGGDSIDTIKKYIDYLHGKGYDAFTVWSKIAQLDRKVNKASPTVSRSGHVTIPSIPIANVIAPNEEQHGYHQEIHVLHKRGQFRDYKSAIDHRLKYFIDEEARQALADEITREFERIESGKGYIS